MATRRFAPRRVRRPTFWEGGRFNLSIPTASAVGTTLVPESTLENVPEPTLVRIRGSILCTMLSAAAVPNAVFLTLGIKLATATAVAASSFELPGTDIGSDWIWWQKVPLVLITGGSVASPNGDGLTSNVRVDVDSKAMRKVKQNEVLILVAENQVSESTGTVGVDGGVRVLFKR